MGEAARQVLETLERLPEAEREVVGAILRSAALSEQALPEEQELVDAADRLFLEFDRHEQLE